MAEGKWIAQGSFFYLSLFMFQDFLCKISYSNCVVLGSMKTIMINRRGRECDVFCLFAFCSYESARTRYSFERRNMLIEPLVVVNSSVLNQLISNKISVKMKVLLSLSFW